MSIVLDPDAAGPAFPRIHEGRYEVDPWATGLRTPVPEGLSTAVKRCGIRFLRVGIGCWLPTQDPDRSNHADREWFLGTTLADVDDDANFRWTHLDRNLEVARHLDVELLLSFDYMPASLARSGRVKELPQHLRPFAPKGYEFPNGVREAPPADPDVFAAACVKALAHVREAGVAVRYVELWNEPDLPFFYSGSYAEFFSMYDAFARGVKAAGYRVGGPSWAGVLDADEWLTQFIRDCATTGTPLDFYSFHRYDEVVDKVVLRCREVRAALDENGFADAEAIIDEWGYDLRQAPYHGTVGNAAFTASCLMQMPAAGIAAQTQVLLVDPDPDPSAGRLHGLTRRDGDPNPITLCLEWFEQFQATPLRLPTSADDAVLAGVDAGGSALSVLLTNPDKNKDRLLTVRLVDGPATATLRRLTQGSFDTAGGWSDGETLTLGADPVSITLPPESLASLTASLTPRS